MGTTEEDHRVNFGRRRRRHPIDVVYDMMVASKEGISPTKLSSVLGLQYSAFTPIVKEMVKLGLLADEPSTRLELAPPRWANVKMTVPGREGTTAAGVPSDDGYFHRYKTLEKGYEFIKHYEALAGIIGEKIESPA